MGQMGTVGGTLDVDELAVGEVVGEPGSTLPVPLEGTSSSSDEDGNGDRRHVEGRMAATDGRELADQRRTLGTSCLPGRRREPFPGVVAHQVAKEGLGDERRVTGERCPRWRSRVEHSVEPGQGWFVGPDPYDGARAAGCRCQGDHAAVAVADDHGGPTVEDVEEVVDVLGEGRGHRSGRTGAVVATPVVGDDREVAEAADDPCEAGRPVERAVHEHDEGQAGRRPGGAVVVDGQREVVAHARQPARSPPVARHGCRSEAELSALCGSRSGIVVASTDQGDSVPVTKSDLIAAVAAHTGSTAKDVATVLAGLEDVVVANVAKGEKVVLTGFLTFERTQRAARTGRNPQTGEAIKIKASKAPKVSAGASFKKVVNGQAPAPKLTRAK